MLSQQFTLSVTRNKIFSRKIARILRQKHNFRKFRWDTANIILWHNNMLSKTMGSRAHFERIGSNLLTLLYLLQTVDVLSQQLDITQEPIVYRLLLQSVVCSSPKKGYEKQARGIARRKRKRRGTKTWTGERSPFSPSPWRIFSLTLAFPVLLVLTTVEPLH